MNEHMSDQATTKRCHSIIVGAGAFEDDSCVQIHYIKAAQEIYKSVSEYSLCICPQIYHMANSARINYDFEKNMENTYISVFVFISGDNDKGIINLYYRNDLYSIDDFLKKSILLLEKNINVVLFMDIFDFNKNKLDQFSSYTNFAFVCRNKKWIYTPKDLYIKFNEFIKKSERTDVYSFCEFFQNIKNDIFYVKFPKRNFTIFAKHSF